MTVNAFTDLVITTMGVSPYSARGLKQTLTPIKQASQVKRTVNGNLKDISFEGFHKYESEISGTDMEPPAIDNIWPGLQVTIDCIYELSYLTVGGSPGRTVVSGSSRTSGDFTIYRPQLIMRIVNFNCDRDEYGAAVSWSMSLEEI